MSSKIKRPLDAQSGVEALEALVQSKEREVADLQRQLSDARAEADGLRPHARLGAWVAPKGSSRERFIRLVVLTRRVLRTEGVVSTAKHVARRLGLSRPQKTASTETATPVESTTIAISPARGDEVARRLIAQVSRLESLAKIVESAWEVARSSAARRLPTYSPDDGESISADDCDVKVVAFYLPQFHPIPENDEWWGKGFTEWTNVAKAAPVFPGHYQPHLPDELGFYDLRLGETMCQQVSMAKQHGLAGFCFYHYWFDGKTLLDAPLKAFVDDPEIDFPFCLMWANENWTRRWDGNEQDVLIGQTHTPESDIAFLVSVMPYLTHPRYIRIHDRPVLMIYRPQLFPDIRATIGRWREYCRERGLPDPYLICSQAFEFVEDPRQYGFDAAVEFPPHGMFGDQHLIHGFGKEGVPVVNPRHVGAIHSYPSVVGRQLARKDCPEYPLYETAFPMWDNTARKPDSSRVFAFPSPDLFLLWMVNLLERSAKYQRRGERFVFVNAWNEWAEGAHLEPDRRYGFAFLQSVREALRRLKMIQAKEIELPFEVDVDQDHSEDFKNPPRSPILIFQMGKVGSTALHFSLLDQPLTDPVFQLHVLNNLDRGAYNYLQYALRHSPRFHRSVGHIEHCHRVRQWMDTAPEATWRVITMVREPVGRNISAFFQALPELIPNVDERLGIGDISAEEIFELFKHVARHEVPEVWFRHQFKPVFGFNPLNLPFDHEKGYSIYDQGRTQLLVMRFEDLRRVAPTAVQEFLGVENLVLPTMNTSADKPYASLIRDFKKIPMPEEYLDRMYDLPLARHYYTAEEIARFRNRWRPSS